ncbi:transporter substrate-binding domain-containing protein [Companilactobacillus ginsenosidimutans]|uniref:Amino acid ABC transporter substrate-binding protein n=1 Tax=Companilactobacillus ginsenosidimutans TaxID=1007676 RepID=A0A0H4QKL2_9LACO|nr:transporter substrate-binding domain-containing protein [Companilactobacillus ginsenosidimutans]AKP67258.1 amino acid ABC transporter substrate-binding protein [Companilactobacillus ginsenosidimutans]
MLKKWIKAIGVLMFFGLILAGCGNKSDSAKDSNKPLVVATSGTLFPTSYHDTKSQKLTGYDIEVVRAVAKKMGRKVTFKEYNVDGQLTAVKTGKADIAANDFSVSPKRKDQYFFSTPYKHSFSSIMVRKSDDSGIHTWADIKGKKAAGEAGTGYQRLAKKLGATLVNYDNVSNDVYLKDVKSGKTDMIMNDYYLQKLALTAVPDNGLKLLDNMYYNTPEDKSGAGMVMKKGNTDLQKQVNKALKELDEDGTLSKISKKFYNADVTKKPTEKISRTFGE